jgi:hypothetical protein
VREGHFDMRQDRPFAPIWVRKRAVRLEVVDRGASSAPASE